MAASDKDFGQVIKLLSSSDLREVYYELGISSTDWHKWEEDAGERASVNLRARSVLETWRKREASKASRQAILNALESCRNIDAKEQLQKLWEPSGKRDLISSTEKYHHYFLKGANGRQEAIGIFHFHCNFLPGSTFVEL